MGLSYLRSILVVLGEIKLAMEPQPRGMVKPQNIFTEPSPFELFTPSERKRMGLDKLIRFEALKGLLSDLHAHRQILREEIKLTRRPRLDECAAEVDCYLRRRARQSREHLVADVGWVPRTGAAVLEAIDPSGLRKTAECSLHRGSFSLEALSGYLPGFH